MTDKERRKAMFFAYARGRSISDIGRALNIGQVQALRILQQDRWMYNGLTYVHEYERQREQSRNTQSAAQSGD